MQSIDKIVRPLPFERGDYLYAYTPKIPTGYCISFEDCQYWLTIDGGNETLKGPFGTEAEAVAAAQSHFNAAIASAIDLSAFRPSIIHYEEGDYSQMLLDDCATITGYPMVLVEPLYRMSDRALIGFQWHGKETSAIDLDKVRRETWEEAARLIAEASPLATNHELAQHLRARATAKGEQTG